MKWFGPAPFAPICGDIEQVPAPAGLPCAWCEEPIVATDNGYVMPLVGLDSVVDKPWHADCQMRQVVGGFNHIRGTCTCCGGADPPDPPNLSTRAAAELAVFTFAVQLASARAREGTK